MSLSKTIRKSGERPRRGFHPFGCYSKHNHYEITAVCAGNADNKYRKVLRMVSYRHVNEKGTEVLNTVNKYGNCARVNVPISWIGRTFRVELIEEKQSPITGNQSL